LSRKGTKSGPRNRKPASTGAKASARTGRTRASKVAPAKGGAAHVRDLERKLEAHTRELSEALERQAATSEVLKVISSSAGELKPVYDAVLESAVSLCEAKFGVLYRYDGNLFHPEAWGISSGPRNALTQAMADGKGGPHRRRRRRAICLGTVGRCTVAPRGTHDQG
jgi:hypothetical protein